MTHTLSLQQLLDIAQKNDGYQFASLNEILHLNYQSLTKIPPDLIEHFTELRTLYLNHNAIGEISEGMRGMGTLSALYLQNNAVSVLENLPPNLRKCIVSENQISEVRRDVTRCPLNDLCLDHNNLKDLNDFRCLFEDGSPSREGGQEEKSQQQESGKDNENKAGKVESATTPSSQQQNRLIDTLQILNLERNFIEDEAIIDLVANLKHLRYLKLQGNPFVRKAKHYRRRIISSLPELTFLDENPVTPEERRLAMAWKQGGMDAVKEMQQLLTQEREQKRNANHQFMEDLMNEARREKEAEKNK